MNASRPKRSQIIQEFAAATRALREARGLTIEQLAERSGIKLQTLIRLEAGEYDPFIGDLIKLSAGFAMDPTEFIQIAIKPGNGRSGGDA